MMDPSIPDLNNMVMNPNNDLMNYKADLTAQNGPVDSYPNNNDNMKLQQQMQQ